MLSIKLTLYVGLGLRLGLGLGLGFALHHAKTANTKIKWITSSSAQEGKKVSSLLAHRIINLCLAPLAAQNTGRAAIGFVVLG